MMSLCASHHLCVRTKRVWRPNVQRKTFYSEIFDMKLKLRVTAAAMRWIDKAGGFDSYIYHTPPRKLASKLGVALKERMHQIVQNNPSVQPPPLVKRYHRPPRSLQNLDTTTSTVSNTSGTKAIQ